MKIVLLVAVLIGLTVGGFAYFNRNQSTSGQSSAGTTSELSKKSADTTTSPSQPNQQGSAGAYVDYSSSVIASTTGTKILFFYAPWCPRCRALEASIKGTSIPDSVTIIKVDYDSNQALRQKYGVTIQTTLVKIDDDGNLVKKYVAYDEPTFASVKSNLL